MPPAVAELKLVLGSAGASPSHLPSQLTDQTSAARNLEVHQPKS